MACREREVTPRFAPGILTPEQRGEAERRYSMCCASGYNCAKIDITRYPSAFRRRTLYGVWLALVEDIWDDLQERHNNQSYSFAAFRKARAKHDVDREVCELAVDFYQRNRLLVWEQFVNACSPFFEISVHGGFEKHGEDWACICRIREAIWRRCRHVEARQALYRAVSSVRPFTEAWFLAGTGSFVQTHKRFADMTSEENALMRRMNAYLKSVDGGCRFEDFRRIYVVKPTDRVREGVVVVGGFVGRRIWDSLLQVIKCYANGSPVKSNSLARLYGPFIPFNCVGSEEELSLRLAALGF